MLALRPRVPAASTGLSTAGGQNYLGRISANRDGICLAPRSPPRYRARKSRTSRIVARGFSSMIQ